MIRPRASRKRGEHRVLEKSRVGRVDDRRVDVDGLGLERPVEPDDDGAPGRAALDDGRLDRLRLRLEIGLGGLELGEQVPQPSFGRRRRLRPSQTSSAPGKSA